MCRDIDGEKDQVTVEDSKEIVAPETNKLQEGLAIHEYGVTVRVVDKQDQESNAR